MADALPYFSTAFELEQGQDKFWLSTNALVEVLANKLAALLAVTITSADVTLTAGQCQNAEFIRASGALTGNKNLIVETPAKFYTISHEGTGNHTITIKTASGTGVAITQGTVTRVYCDGTNVVPATGATGSGGAPYDFNFSVDGLPGDGGVMLKFVCVRAIRLPQNLPSSEGVAGVAGTVGVAAFDIKKNGSSVGTISFAVAATTATFTKAADTDFAVGDILTIIAPSPQNATLADIAVTLAGIRL